MATLAEPDAAPADGEEPVATNEPARAWTLRRRVGTAFAVLTLLLLALVTVVVFSFVDFARNGNEVIHRWQPASMRSEALLTDLVNQETGIRGFALTGKAEFLQPFNDFVNQESTDALKLDALIKHETRLELQFAAVLTAARDWQTTVAVPVVRSLGTQPAAALSLVDSSQARLSFDNIRSASAVLTASLSARAKNAIDERQRSGVFFVIALSIASLLVVVAAVQLWRGMHRWVLAPIDGLAAQTRLIAAGDPQREIVPTGPPELRQLGADVDAMRRRIADELAHIEEVRLQLLERSDELARSNADLQQFAYVASHDLAEPLRKVANFCQLLERQYGPQLDDKAREYIFYAVDGAKRMQALINDLLALSRVGRSSSGFVAVDTGAALRRALSTLEDRIREAGVRVEVPEHMPTVLGDATLLASLFENLVGNSVKYRGATDPRVTVSVGDVPVDGFWSFAVADNGIGIDAQFADRIFTIFQRLHLRDEYEGTGIGLSLCRRIVEFHGGDIWLDTAIDGPGATFRFTLREDRGGEDE